MWVRPSTASYGGFSLDVDRSPGFGSARGDSLALLRLGFPSASRLRRLTSPPLATRRTVLQKVRGPSPRDVPQFVDAGFQALFHSPPGVLFTFPSQYFALSVTGECLALGGGPPDFPQGFPCPAVLWIPPVAVRLRLRGLHPLRLAFPKPFGWLSADSRRSVTPARSRAGLGWPPFARRYSGDRVFFPFLWVLRCFSSPGSLPRVMDWRVDT